MAQPRTNPHLTPEEIRQVLIYDPETGIFLWRFPHLHRRHSKEGGVGCLRTTPNKPTYRVITIRCWPHLGHRLAWAYVYGDPVPPMIDHVDGNGLNNAIANLRGCTQTQNNANMRLRRTSKSGHKGVSWHTRVGRWRVVLQDHDRHVHVGYFDDLSEAAAAYAAKAKELFGEFARVA